MLPLTYLHDSVAGQLTQIGSLRAVPRTVAGWLLEQRRVR